MPKQYQIFLCDTIDKSRSIGEVWNPNNKIPNSNKYQYDQENPRFQYYSTNPNAKVQMSKEIKISKSKNDLRTSFLKFEDTTKSGFPFDLTSKKASSNNGIWELIVRILCIL